MGNKMLAILGVAVITIGAIGGSAFASNVNNNFKENQQIKRSIRDGSFCFSIFRLIKEALGTVPFAFQYSA